MNKNQPYGLQALTPIYGQVIQSTPSWSGPYDVPPIAPPVKLPKQPSATGLWAGMVGNLLGTSACAAMAETGVGLLACPILGQISGVTASDIISGL